MTTLFHSGHNALKASHLWNYSVVGEGSLCAPAALDLLQLGQYRILECLGSGGMGKVFLAEHQLMGRKVAIKVMSPTLLSDPECCSRFRQEVRLVARLCHPHIVLAHDADEKDGVHYFVMEYVDGADLGHIVAQHGSLPIPFACECIRQTALGLQHAHEHGLVHCDIKPSNLLLKGGMTSLYRFLGRRAGENQLERPMVKILDFGLARLAGKAGALRSNAGSSELELCGTPDFMAPELGRDSTTVDIRCDLYSLGCTFSFLLTGQVPYPGGSWSEKLIRHHYDAATPVCHMRPDVPHEIAELVGRLMAKDPGDRFAIPGEVALAIQGWQETEMLAEKAETNSSASRYSKPIDLCNLHAADSAPTPVLQDRASRAAHGNRLWPRIRFAWPLAAAFAIAAGLGSAWMASTPVLEKTIGSVKTWATPAEHQSGFRLGERGPTFDRLDQAIALAKDGDTIFVRGNGPFLIHGVSCRGKSLTIKAATGFRPRFEFLAAPRKSDWTPLFWANRDLTLEGIELKDPGEKASVQGDVAHLVYVENSALKIINCKITGRRGRNLIVARGATAIEINGAVVEGKGSLLCVEPPESGDARICLNQSTLSASDPDASVAVLWSACQPHATCDVKLEECELVGARLFALNGLDGAVSIRSSNSSLRFHQALLSLIPSDRSLPPTRLVHWSGDNNRFGSSKSWITSTGAMEPVRSLQEWKNCWNSSEKGSSEDNLAALPVSHPHAD